MSDTKNEEIFKDLQADLDPEITEIESLCVQCGNNGITKLLLTKIPFYKEVVLMSFSCENCHWENNQLEPAATIQEKGIQYKLHVCNNKDIGRQVVRTKEASIAIPELNFEIPSGTQEGAVTTIEGVLQRAYDGIHSKQQELERSDPDSSEKLLKFLKNLQELIECKTSFHFILRDCTGNSFLETLCAPKSDPELEITHFSRTREEAILLGIVSEELEDSVDEDKVDVKDESGMTGEVLEFATNCPNCKAPCITNMKLTDIPLFKNIVLMATVCEACGHKTTEVKSGGGIEDHGIKYSLSIKNERDLARDLLKSDTCYVHIPELELEVGPSALNGCYTTVEGLITNVKKQLVEDNPLVTGDSAPPELKSKMQYFLEQLNKILTSESKCTLILDDPCGSSYLQSYDTPDSDCNLAVNKYERTFDQNEELGLNDMKVENYEET